MSIEEKLIAPERKPKKRSRVSETFDREFPFEADPDANKGYVSKVEPMKDFYRKIEHEQDYMGFKIRRSPMYMLHHITLNDKPVRGLLGSYTRPSIAKEAIDSYINEQEKKNEKRKAKATANGNT
jgi:hypothetical protein